MVTIDDPDLGYLREHLLAAPFTPHPWDNYVLHLWRPNAAHHHSGIPLPLSWMVGPQISHEEAEKMTHEELLELVRKQNTH